MAVIYGLCDPLTGQLRYVGKANDAASRLRGHLRNRATKTPVQRWIAKPGRSNLKPEQFEIERAEDWVEAEQFWIAYFRSIGAALLNVSPGGVEPGAEACRRAVVARETGPNAEINKHLRSLGQYISRTMKEAQAASGPLRKQLFLAAYKIRFKLKCLKAIL